MAPLPLKTGDRSYYKVINKRRQSQPGNEEADLTKGRPEDQS